MSARHEMKIVPSNVRAARARKAAISRTRQYLAAHPEIEQGALEAGARVMGVLPADLGRVRVHRRINRTGVAGLRMMAYEAPLPADIIEELQLRGPECAVEILDVMRPLLVPICDAAHLTHVMYIADALSAAPASARLDPSVWVQEVVDVDYIFSLDEYRQVRDVLLEERVSAFMSTFMDALLGEFAA